MLDDVGRHLASVDREYADFLADQKLMVVAAARAALQQLVVSAQQRLAEGAPVEHASRGAERARDRAEERADATLGLFEEAGRDHFRRDRPLGTLLSAYQTGGLVAWRHIARTAVRLHLPAEALAALAEGVFQTVDTIGAATTGGYLQEQAESAGMREQWRSALAEQLMTDGVEPATLEQLAQRAAWPLPQQAAVVVLRADDQAGVTAVARLVHSGLPVGSATPTAVIVPDAESPAFRQRLSTLLRGCRAVVGPTVALADLPESARVTRDAAWALELPAARSSPFFVDEHLDAVIVHRHPRLLNRLRVRCLAPLEAAAPGSRRAFQDTLRSWLLHMGDGRAVAADLHVHPQTVRYRMHRLHDLFGPVLDEPEGRLRLLLALAWDPPAGGRRSAGGGRSGAADPGPPPAPARRTSAAANPARARGSRGRRRSPRGCLPGAVPSDGTQT